VLKILKYLVVKLNYHSFVSVECALGGCFVAAGLADIRLVALVDRVVVCDERGLLTSLVVAQLARKRLLVEVNNPMVHLQRLVRLELLAASLAHVHLEKKPTKVE